MKNRRKRIDLIIELINNFCVSSQEELSDLLQKKGHNVTQATLSRDLKMLRTTKMPTDRGTYIYVLPDSNTLKDKLLSTGVSQKRVNYHSGLLSIAFSGNMVVIKTRNGYAPGLAYEIDSCRTNEILGTIAGADTIFAVLKEDVSRERAHELFSSLLSVNISDFES